jgi:tRNA pseudouridine32 synthase/23S rRNA pseudouridine746 synthase
LHRLVRPWRPGEPNAETLVEAVGDRRYRLTPRTGRTRQLRVQMASIGLPIDGDPLYPNAIDVPADDFSAPLQLLAYALEFDGRRFVSRRSL